MNWPTSIRHQTARTPAEPRGDDAASPVPGPAVATAGPLLRRRAAQRLRLTPLGYGLLGSAVAGLALDATFAPIGWWPLAVPAVAALLLALRGRSWRAGLLLGLVAGLAEFVPLLAWLRVVTPLAWFVLAVAEAAYLAAFGAAATFLITRVPAWPVWTACLWVSEEFVRARWPLGGFTWGRLAFSQPDTPFTGFAALGGAPLVTFAVGLAGAFLAVAALAAVALRPGQRRPTMRWAGSVRTAAAALVGIVVIGLAGALVPRPTDGQAVQVAVVQGNVPHPGTHFLGRAEQVLDNHLAETAKLTAAVAAGTLPKPQLVLWPENASDVDPFHDAHAYAQIQAAAQSIGVPILVGSVLQAGPGHVTNTGIVWDPATGPGERYTKRHLVPFGEYIPWRGFVDHLTSLTSLVPQNFLPGDAPGTLQVGPVRIADVMCFEVAFDDVVRSAVTHGGQLIVVQTNNATYMGTAETRQQLAMSQLRAVEHGRTVVVAATSGISAIVAPDGRVVTQTAEMTPAIIDRSVVVRSATTVADHLGALPEWVLGILGVLAVIAAAIRRAVVQRGARSGTD